MPWVVFSCSFPSGTRSTPRVAVWRRLRRAGAVALKAGLYVLPATDACSEAVQWLSQETRTDGGDPVVMRVEAFEGLTDEHLVGLFHDARREDYQGLSARAGEIERELRGGEREAIPRLRLAVERLRDDYQQVERIDHFRSPDGRLLAVRLGALSDALAAPRSAQPDVPHVSPDEYQDRRWVTRPRPFVDRLGCAWLIRRFVDSAADIRYRDVPEPGEVGFDMNEGQFRHLGNRCTFEVIVEAFALNEPGIDAVAEIVHEIDLHDGRYARPEVAGIESVLEGWRDSDRRDWEIEALGLELFDGLLMSLRRSEAPPPGGRQRP